MIADDEAMCMRRSHNSLRVVDNMLLAIEAWSFKVPRELLKLPAREDVEKAKAQLQKDGGTTEVWEHERRGKTGAWGKRMLPSDPPPFARVGLLAGDKSTLNRVHNLDAVKPHTGFDWDAAGGWKIARDGPTDAEGWEYTDDDAEDGVWSPYMDLRHDVRRRKWVRHEVPEERMSLIPQALLSTKPVDASVERTSHVRWIDDDEADTCMCCQTREFDIWTWKHHCRHCGRVVCDACSQVGDERKYCI